MEKKKMKKSSGKKRVDREKGIEVQATKIDWYTNEGEEGENKEKKLRKKKRKIRKTEKAAFENVEVPNKEVEDGFREDNDGANKERKLRKKKFGKTQKSEVNNVKVLNKEVEDGFREENGVSKKACKAKKDRSSRKNEILVEMKGESRDNMPYEISSGDEDCSRGMKKWITEYRQARPGVKILQERIDDFITAYDAEEEQARKEREALAAEGGWTVVTHHKGRKKTTDTETGITVGSVAETVVLENIAKKKSKEVGPDFYRFQKREARMNEIMVLQSKFEQDKKRIQQLRAARKFRPY
ncbi:uncharacterized protein LOC127803582 [Diospyros lotus]|uniref:uncharacterized protein LOC127803582 n=1 Tax=Diospyros lotus TaxID=55363 RepID=UPI002255D242|nr:uncharacterized protein LOC127803582 [Diospyros lotus]